MDSWGAGPAGGSDRVGAGRPGYCGRKPVSELFTRIRQAPPAGLTADEADGRAVSVLAMLRAVDAVRREERDLEAEIIERLDAHADAHILTSMPRAGHGVRAAALLTEIGDDHGRVPDEESLAALAGVAPVTKASGQARHVGFRWAADKKLRNALIDFADDSRHASPWAAKVYTNAIARGKRHRDRPLADPVVHHDPRQVPPRDGRG